MAYKAEVQTTFEPRRVIRPIYTGGSVSLSQDGRVLASTLGEEALLTDLITGKHLARIEGDGEPLTTLAITPDACYLIACSRSLSMRIYTIHAVGLHGELETRLLRTLKPHATPVVTLALDPTSSLLATGGADGVVKVWELRAGYVTHTFHGHGGVISALHFFQVDSVAEQQTAKSTKKKSRQRNYGVEELEKVAIAGFRLASGDEDGKLRIWDLHRRKSVASLQSHVSVVRSLDYSPVHKVLLSGSRDKTVIIWDTRTWQPVSTVAVLETIEAAGFVENGRFVYTGGESAKLRIWSTETGGEVTEEQEAGSEIEGIRDVQSTPGLPYLLTVHGDQTLVLRSLKPLSGLTPSEQIPALPVLRRISGTHDEVIDLAYVGPDRSFLALATNLEDIRLISLQGENSTETTSPAGPLYFGADAALLKGHSDIIITIDTDWSGQWLATGAKDNTAKLWRLDTEEASYTCFATFTGHAESIGAVALPNGAPPVGSKQYERPLDFPPKFLITGSQDKTIKRWSIAAQSDAAPKAAYTRKAHDKDINAIETSYSANSPLFASASQDRTVKIWDVDSGEAIGVLRGHNRGVWTVAFSPDGIPALTTAAEGGAASSGRGMVLTGSGDKTVKIWSLTDYSCLRTFEGHANSVLKVVWLPPPSKSQTGRISVQVASAAGDGLVKIWDAQTSECAVTLDNHIDRVWALAVKPPPLKTKDEKRFDGVIADEEDDTDDTSLELVSGSADSTLTFWSDTTASTVLEAATHATARIEQDQELQNHIRSNNFREATALALHLNHPKRLLELFSTVINGEHDEGSFTGKREVDDVIASLSDGQLWSLLRRLRDWNANSRTHHVAQRILNAVLRTYSKERLLNLSRRRKAIDVNEHLVDAMAEFNVAETSQSKESVKDVLDALKAYTDRHYQRLEKTAEERFVMVWATVQMDQVSGVDQLSNGLTSGHHMARD